ncbi:MAG: phosphoribosylanthranilate isomerase [Candidatus Brockarchaeota archaeon]|nr:phosphoribosylanthranilate isomerase [Candidatus Brockarchaeota archaeon]
MVRVKICGITRVEDLEFVVNAGADFVGFVVNVPSSPRNLKHDAAARLISAVPTDVKSVVVTIPKSLEDLNSVIQLAADYIQLHGEPSLLIRLTEEFRGKGIIGAVNARLPNALDLAVEYSKIFDIVLLDSLMDNGSGGSGKTHDWELSRIIRERLQPKPLILAGGLTPENVAAAVRIVKPYAVDVSTGVEARPGIKDPRKVSMFIKRAKESEA